MKVKQKNELREQSVEQLEDKQQELAQQLFALRLNKATGQLESPAKVRTVRRDLARVITILREKRT
jgi:large subunit ribosomal protein L29